MRRALSMLKCERCSVLLLMHPVLGNSLAEDRAQVNFFCFVCSLITTEILHTNNNDCHVGIMKVLLTIISLKEKDNFNLLTHVTSAYYNMRSGEISNLITLCEFVAVMMVFCQFQLELLNYFTSWGQKSWIYFLKCLLNCLFQTSSISIIFMCMFILYNMYIYSMWNCPSLLFCYFDCFVGNHWRELAPISNWLVCLSNSWTGNKIIVRIMVCGCGSN